MPEASPSAAERLTAGMYAAAALIVLTAAVDAATSAWPFAPGRAEWRYGAIGLASNFLLTGMLGVLLAIGTAAWRGHGRFLRIAGLVLALGSVALLLAALAFTLDALTLYRQVSPDDMKQFRIGAYKAAAKYVGSAIVFVWVGLGAWRAGRAAREGATRRADAPLIVGRS